MTEAIIAGLFGIAIAFITALLTTLGTIGVTILALWPKLKADLQKEYKNRANEYKWDIYINFVKLIGEIIYSEKDVSLSDMARIHEVTGTLLLIGSDEVVNTYQELRNFMTRLENRDPVSDEDLKMIQEKISLVVNAMRQDLGYEFEIDYEGMLRKALPIAELTVKVVASMA